MYSKNKFDSAAIKTQITKIFKLLRTIMLKKNAIKFKFLKQSLIEILHNHHKTIKCDFL